MIVKATNSFQTFMDLDGNPINNGYIYIGTAGSNPETSAITVYSDSGFTIPVAQPLRTVGGYVVVNGSPINVYTSDDYSITVRDKDGSLVYTQSSGNIDATQTSAIQVVSDAQAAVDAAVADVEAAASSIVAQDAQITTNTNKLATIVSGTYAPTLTATANIASSTAYNGMYIKSGSIVTVSGTVNLQATASSTTTSFRLSLPVATNLSNPFSQVQGTFVSDKFYGYVHGDTVNNELTFSFTSTDTSAHSIKFVCHYSVQ